MADLHGIRAFPMVSVNGLVNMHGWRMSRPIQKEWMNELDRFGDVYKQGVADFIQFATVNNRGSTTCPCPCRECRNGKSFVFGTISRHLIKAWDGDFVDASYGVHEVVASDLNEDEENHMEDFEPPPVLERDLRKRYNEYKKMAEQKLYPSCEAPVTTLSAVVDLHNLKKKYGQPQPSASQPSGSASHASQPSTSVSQASQPSGDMQESENVRKLPVLIDIDGVVVGDNASGWNTSSLVVLFELRSRLVTRLEACTS
ncbi:hypothetical protein IFM89_008062 [Coptis chinensis]|uniref:Transposase-associated domain-containing protein n=1 Tax=Coptis chinensis TaxID=261450 RepID=A0A835IUW8_9MAGN|nr:hypothetical protein IFM89_008062 [Coptis chinensis]